VHVNSKRKKQASQAGFSIIEMMIAATVMLILTGAVVALMKNSIMVATTSYELTDAQESLRAAQEYISRDLMNAGDGLKSINYLPVNTTFVTNYLTTAPVVDSSAPANATILGILTTHNNVATGFTIPAPPPPPSASPMPTPSPIPVLAGTDRQTILEIDPDQATNPQLNPTSITFNTAGDPVFQLPTATTTATMNRFAVGDIYFITSMRGGTFGAITYIDASAKKIRFESGDYCGLNTSGANNRIKDISSNGTIPTTLQRLRIIHYFVDSNRILRRRVFGERGAPFKDTIIAEHVLGVQFVYSVGLDSAGNPVQPTSVITTPVQQVNISQVEVTVTVETPHATVQSLKPQLSTTTATSLRNMQFRQALQPKPSPTP
jgi:prepilin-type N-terminal cleavage/methylation domain-containing protein